MARTNLFQRSRKLPHRRLTPDKQLRMREPRQGPPELNTPMIAHELLVQSNATQPQRDKLRLSPTSAVNRAPIITIGSKMIVFSKYS